MNTIAPADVNRLDYLGSSNKTLRLVLGQTRLFGDLSTRTRIDGYADGPFIFLHEGVRDLQV